MVPFKQIDLREHLLPRKVRREVGELTDGIFVVFCHGV